jgi:hypothetical protein
VIRRIVGAAALLYLLGFAMFMLTLPGPAAPGATDAIVVLTGGKGRIDRGLALLGAHQAHRRCSAAASTSAARRSTPNPMPTRRRGGFRRIITGRCGWSPPIGTCAALIWN